MAVRKDKRNNKWMYDGKYKDAFGKFKSYHKTGFNTKREATKAEIEYLESMKSNGSITLDALFDMYLKQNRHLKERTLLTNERHYNKRIKPFLGDIHIDNINVQMVNSWLSELSKTSLKESTILEYKKLFCKILDFGVKMDLIKSNPVRKVTYKAKKEIIDENKVWTKEQFQQFIKCVDDEMWNAVFTTFYYTGMRRGELMALTWNDINFDTNKIRINKTLTEMGTITTPKTQNSIRSLSMNKTLFNELFKRFESQKHLDGFTLDYYVFGGIRWLSFSSIDKALKCYCVKAGLEPISTHKFRHANASLLIRSQKFDDGVISERLGHTVYTLRQTYAHVYEDMRQNVGDEIENIL